MVYRQTKHSSQIDQRHNRASKIGDPRQQTRHARHDGHGFHLEDFADMAEINGEGFPAQRQDAHARGPFAAAAESLDGRDGPGAGDDSSGWEWVVGTSLMS